MKIIISSARTMEYQPTDNLKLPILLDQTEEILNALKEHPDLKKVWKCSDSMYHSSTNQLEEMDLYHDLTPAIHSYQGVVYQQFKDMIDSHVDYLDKHLLILSAFYGVLHPFDGIRPYRLEMNANLKVKGKNLRDYWSYHLYEECRSDVILNLASEEYGQCVRHYLNDSDEMIDIDFIQVKNHQEKHISTQMKKARGLMLRYMMEQEIEDLSLLKNFTLDGYQYCEERSTASKLTFIKQE